MSIPVNDTSSIDYWVVGEAQEEDRSVSQVPTNNAVTDAYFSIYHLVTDPENSIAPVLECHITATLTTSGQITDNGATSGTAQLAFQFTGAQTATLQPAWPYHYHIKVVTADSQSSFPEIGTLTPLGS